jgi:hypothetical protein
VDFVQERTGDVQLVEFAGSAVRRYMLAWTGSTDEAMRAYV